MRSELQCSLPPLGKIKQSPKEEIQLKIVVHVCSHVEWLNPCGQQVVVEHTIWILFNLDKSK